MNNTIHLYFVNLGIRENAKNFMAPRYASESSFLDVSNPAKAHYEFIPTVYFIGKDIMEIAGRDNHENRRIIFHFSLKVYLPKASDLQYRGR